MRVLRVSHSAVVDEWRGRERALADLGVDVDAVERAAVACGRHAGVARAAREASA